MQLTSVKVKIVVSALVVGIAILVAYEWEHYSRIKELYHETFSFCSKIDKGLSKQELLALANSDKEKIAVFAGPDRVRVTFKRSSSCAAEIENEKVKAVYVVYND